MKSRVNELQEKLIKKAEFFKHNEIKCHVSLIPKPNFKNGLFVSGLQDEKFFWFIDDTNPIPFRLFLFEIMEINEYRSREERENEKCMSEYWEGLKKEEKEDDKHTI